MFFKRTITFNNISTSAFLFGPRMVGKTTALKNLKYSKFFDLLDPELEL